MITIIIIIIIINKLRLNKVEKNKHLATKRHLGCVMVRYVKTSVHYKIVFADGIFRR